MPIKISTMTDAEKAAALKKTYEWIDGAAKTDLIAIFKGQKIKSIVQFLMVRNPDFETMTLFEEATDGDGNKIITSTELTKPQIGLMKDLKQFLIFLCSDESKLGDSITAVTKDNFEEWQLNNILQGPTVIPPTPGTPGTPAGGAGGTPAPAPTTNTPGLDIPRQIAAIDKFDAKLIPVYNGSVRDWPRVKRQSVQTLKNWNMQNIIDASFTYPADDGSDVSLLWIRQNAFFMMVLTNRFTGGQATIFVRRNQSDPNGGHKCWKAFIQHYESPGNKTIAVTQITSALQKLTYSNRSNFALDRHLTQFQALLQDLDDIEIQTTASNGTQITTTAKPDEIQAKSLLIASITHSAFTPMLDQYLTDPNKDVATIVTELSQKSDRMGKPDVSHRSLNNSSSGNRRGNRNGNRNNNNTSNGHQDSEWWKPPNEWRAMSAAAKADWNRRKRQAWKDKQTQPWRVQH